MIPEGPGADLLDMQERLRETSSSEMGAKSRGGSGAGSEGSESGTGFRTIGKNRSDRTWRRSVWEVARVPSNFRRGGILLAHRPWRHAVAFHRVSRVTVVKLSLDHPRFASAMVCLSTLIAALRDSPRMEVTAVRAASQCMFHHQRPQKSGVCRCLNNFPDTA